MQSQIVSFPAYLSVYDSFSTCKHSLQSQKRNWNKSKIKVNHYNILVMNEYFANHIRQNCDTNVDESDNIQHSVENCKKWSITLQELKVIPPYYPIDLTHKVIHSTTIELVHRRLTQCIKTYDIAIKWSSREPSLLYCSTNCLLFFEINLWKKADRDVSPPNEHDLETSSESIDMIIEIRRHDGDCVRFHHLRNILYGAICHEEFLNLKEVCGGDRRIHSINNSDGNCSVPRFMQPLNFDTLIDVMNSVAMAFEMVFSEISLDTTMGLQMLVFLTDSTSIHKVYAGHVCDFILLGLDVFGNAVVAVPEVIHNYAVSDRQCIEHHYALQILANVFENNSYKLEIPQNYLQAFESWNSVIPSLIKDMKNVVNNPHVAYNAMRCLRNWYLFGGGTVADPTYIREILEYIESIETYGKQYYISLEKESNKLKLLLENFHNL